MNFKYVFGFLSLICSVSQARAWKWNEVYELNEALQNDSFFFGMDVTEMSDEEKKNICSDAFGMSPQNVVPSGIINLDVGIIVDGNVKQKKFMVFSCHKSNGEMYFFGIGPRKNTIAVYTKSNELGVPYRIMNYSS